MSDYVKADHHLIQPRPKDYIERAREDGTLEKVLVGPYSLEQRNKFMKIMISLYMTRHPNQKYARAKQASFHKWRNLVFATLNDRPHVISADQKLKK